MVNKGSANKQAMSKMREIVPIFIKKIKQTEEKTFRNIFMGNFTMIINYFHLFFVISLLARALITILFI